jgi:elongation factor P--beta-lysine ligase
MNLTINVSDELYRKALEIAAAEKVSVEDLFASSLEERIVELERLKERAVRGSYEKFRQLMSKVPPVEPPEYDRL